MAHLVSPEVFQPGYESREVTTEAQTTLKDFTAEDVQFILTLLAYNNTKYERTAKQLESTYGIRIHSNTLKNWVTNLFTQKYVEIQHTLDQQLSDKLSGQAVDLASSAMEAEELALKQAINTIPDLKANEVGSAVKNYAEAASKNIQNAQLLNDKPTSIVKHQTPDDALKVLKELGLLQEAEVVEEED